MALFCNWREHVAQMLLGAEVQDFLRCVFHHGLASSTHVEHIFAHLQQYALRCSHPPHLASFAAHHVSTEQTRIWRRWLHKADLAPARRLCRPIWVQSKRRRLQRAIRQTSWSVFLHRHCATAKAAFRDLDRAQLGMEFRQLGAHERKDLRREARHNNAASKAAVDPLQSFVQQAEQAGTADYPNSPWGMADRNFPVSVASAKAQQCTGFVKQRHRHWQHTSSAVKEAIEGFPAIVEQYVPCTATLCQTAAAYGMDEIIEALCLIVAPHGIELPTLHRPLICALGPCTVTFLNTSVRKSPFAGEFIQCSVDDLGQPGILPPVPFDCNLMSSDMFGSPIPAFLTEQMAAHTLASMAPPDSWKFLDLTYAVKAPACLSVTCVTAIDLAELRVRVAAARRVSGALKVAQRLFSHGPARPACRERPPRHLNRGAGPS